MSARTVTFHKVRRAFGDPVEAPKQHPRFEPPPFTNNTNLLLPLDVVLPNVAQHVEAAGQLVFQAVGDTGGIHDDSLAQVAVADHMEAQIASAADRDKPQFFYHLGDIVYYNGISYHYPEQFYDPYKHYPAPIFAIAGNHDGDTNTRPTDETDPEPTLTGFMRNFCDTQTRYIDTYRPTMTQPYVYWTLDAPFLRIIGLYSNVDGLLDGLGTYQQQAWFEDQMIHAPTDKCLIVTVHHPPYSLDGSHGGYSDIGNAIDRAAKAAGGRYPDAVFTGHVHNYQRFERVVHHQHIPYVVAGAGGYAMNAKAIHKMQRDTNKNVPVLPFRTLAHNVTLEKLNEVDSGFLRLTVDAQMLKGEYFAVPFDGPAPTDAFDTFTVNWKR